MANQNNKLNNKLKVAIISSLTGGLGHYCAHLAGPLSKYCFIKFITYPQLDLSGIPVNQITDSIIRKYIKWPRFDIDENNPQSIININEYLKSKNINLINLHIGTTVKKKINYFMTFILYAKKSNDTKFIFTLHDVLPFEGDKKIIKLLKVFYSFSDFFTVGNEGEKNKLEKYFQVPSTKIKIIPHGIYNLFDKEIYNKQTARGYLDLPFNKKILLFFGFLREYKGMEYLIKATRILRKKRDDFVIYIASSFKYAPKSFLEKNLKLIKKLAIEDSFILNFRYLDSSDIEAVFKACDIVVLPYIHVSQSGVLMMACGFKKPVIITDIFSEKDWINEKAGLVAKIKNPQSLAEKINILLKDEEKIKKFGEYGYNYALKNFNWEITAQKYYEVFKKVVL